MRLAILNWNIDDLTAADLDDVCALEFRTNGPRAMGRKAIRAALRAADASPLPDTTCWAAFGAHRRTGGQQFGPLEAWAAYCLRRGVLHFQALTISPAAMADHADAAILELITEELAAPSSAITIWTTAGQQAQPYTPCQHLLACLGFQWAAHVPKSFGTDPGCLYVHPRQSGLTVGQLIREATHA